MGTSKTDANAAIDYSIAVDFTTLTADNRVAMSITCSKVADPRCT